MTIFERKQATLVEATAAIEAEILHPDKYLANIRESLRISERGIVR